MTDHWHILGAGAVGGLFACRLRALRSSVTLLTRTPSSGARSLMLHDHNGQREYTFPEAPISAKSAIQKLLVCTKAFDVRSAIAAISHRLTPKSTVILLANGMGFHHEVRTAIGSEQLFAATTTVGVYRPDKDTLINVSEGTTTFGSLSRPEARPGWYEQFTQAPWPCIWTEDIYEVLLNKLSINCVINPVTAINDIDNGRIFDEPFAATTLQAIEEVSSVLDWAGRPELAQGLKSQILQIAKATARNTSSMRADLLAGRRTEVNEVLGFLLESCDLIVENHPRPATPLLSEWLNTLRQRSPNP